VVDEESLLTHGGWISSYYGWMDVPSAIGNHVSVTCNRQLSFVLSKFAAARASTVVVARHKSPAYSLLARTHPTTDSTFPHTVQ